MATAWPQPDALSRIACARSYVLNHRSELSTAVAQAKAFCRGAAETVMVYG